MTTEALLDEVLGPAEAPALFEWLRGLSFVEQGPEGLFPHDLAREVLDADLRWRDPDGFRDLHGRVLRHLVRRLQAHTGREQQRAYFDFVYLSRNSRLMRNYYDWDTMGTAYAGERDKVWEAMPPVGCCLSMKERRTPGTRAGSRRPGRH
jgi:hypothetical protein